MSGWSRQTRLLDWVILGLVVPLSSATIYLASWPITGTENLLVAVPWIVMGAAWAVSLHVGRAPTPADPESATLVLALVMAGLGVVFWILGPYFLAVFGLALGFHLVTVLRNRRRLIWLTAPLVATVTFALVFSGVPKAVHFAATEEALNEYVDGLQAGIMPRPDFGDDPVYAGDIAITEVRFDDGLFYLTTGYVGVLADDGAGLVRAPGGLSLNSRLEYQHLKGDWYLWFPY